VGALLLVAIMAGASYFFLRPRSQPATSAVPAQVATVTPAQNPQPPAASGAPATAAAAPKPSEAAPKAGLVSNPEPRPHTAGAKVGQLMISANVNGARISVDGRSDPDWLTPHTIPDLPSGAHNIVVSMNGYDDFRQSVTIDGGQTSNVVASLSSPSAEFGVVTVPAGVEVLIDGKSYGPSPVRTTLPPGNHTYTIKQPGAQPFENTVTLKSSDIITRKVTLPTAAKTGIAEVRSIPTGASVLADGTPVGGQTPTSFRLSVGTHTLVISLSGYRPIQRQITVSENETAPVNVTLTSQ
jgi:hypothetical protein